MERRIYLEKLTSQDFDEYYGMVGNEKVMAMITERALSEEEVLEKFNYHLQNNELHPSFGTFMVLEALSKRLVGCSKLEIKEGTR